MIGRRQFITLLAGAAAWPFAADAEQSGRMRKLGVLIPLPESDPSSHRRVSILEAGLAQLGWIAGRNIKIDYRWNVSDDEKARTAAAQLLEVAPDVILANATTAVTALQQSTRVVPVVFTGVSDPVAQGLVASLARPAGNITGFTNFEPSTGGKWLELLREAAPQVSRVAIMFRPGLTQLVPMFYDSARQAAASFAIELIEVMVHDLAEVKAGLGALARAPGGGLIVPPDTYLATNHELVIQMVAAHRLPAIYPFRYFAAAGGLMSYGPDLDDQIRRATAYIDRILRGEKPEDLPVQQPTKFELVINLKMAKGVGLELPATVLARADEVIE
jgi:putative tryptophan/tyrosine transport system substrate-binding protein